ncbi:hypothetical protein [Paenibacillus azoreducens]|uniref:Uncharacterized protein n=1 Tax=Paenibacillus azoreducens TaxID=116718 RepID=A0A920CSD3_9BACL|nr:hypothetical protein [Paenibacillus azoreducens]GIO47247.1 hypothetical protein J34TS1_20120 [Paenibacillus azoreducens]
MPSIDAYRLDRYRLDDEKRVDLQTAEGTLSATTIGTISNLPFKPLILLLNVRNYNYYRLASDQIMNSYTYGYIIALKLSVDSSLLTKTLLNVLKTNFVDTAEKTIYFKSVEFGSNFINFELSEDARDGNKYTYIVIGV